MARETLAIMRERLTMQEALTQAMEKRLARATGLAFAVGALLGAVGGFALGLAL